MVVSNRIPTSWQRNVPLATYTTLQVGGPAEYFVTVKNFEELVATTKKAQSLALPITVLGGGSNVLIADEGIPGLVVHMALDKVRKEEKGTNIEVECGAGVNFDAMIAKTVAAGWWGLENLSSIPGTVGATPIQNVGAYGVEVADLIESIAVYDYHRGNEFRLTKKECQFGYRHSIFKTKQARSWIITAVTFALSSVPCPRLSYPDLAPLRKRVSDRPQPIREHVQIVRSQKFPDWRSVGTAGSFFKNPIIDTAAYQRLQQEYPDLPGYPLTDSKVKVPLGWILDQICGLRGYQDGPVGTYERQALVLVQTGGATTADIYRLATYIKETVKTATGISIDHEVTALPVE